MNNGVRATMMELRHRHRHRHRSKQSTVIIHIHLLLLAVVYFFYPGHLAGHWDLFVLLSFGRTSIGLSLSYFHLARRRSGFACLIFHLAEHIPHGVFVTSSGSHSLVCRIYGMSNPCSCSCLCFTTRLAVYNHDKCHVEVP